MQKRGILPSLIVVLIVALMLLLILKIYLEKEYESELSLASLNTPPVFGKIDSEIFVCENQAFSYMFEAFDNDTLEFDISPKDNVPFFVRKTAYGENKAEGKIYSGNLTKATAGKTYVEDLFVTDDQFVESKKVKISVIEINNQPRIENLGVKTISLNKNPDLNTKIKVIDSELDNPDFTIKFLSGKEIFGISSIGVINYTAESADIGNYLVRVCATDHGIENVSERIGLCGQDGSPLTDCEDFHLTVAEKNRKPEIVLPSLSPFLIAEGATPITFNLTKLDPEGAFPDTYWYVDGSLTEYDSGELSDTFTHTFGCKISGLHNVKAEITDGILNDTFTWKLLVKRTACSEDEVYGTCTELWACEDWEVCQHTYDASLPIYQNLEDVKGNCMANNWGEEVCGFQTRSCSDLNKCGTYMEKLPEIRGCYFTLAPSCYDGQRNCHDGGCELVADCGGPCGPCPTCSDELINQGETGTDCGGPCFEQCSETKTIFQDTTVKYNVVVIFGIALIIIILLLSKIRKMKSRLNE